MAQALRYPTSQNFVQKTLGAELLSGVTAAATLNNVTGIQNKPGVMIVDRIDSNNVETPNKREVIQFNATSGSTVTTLTRNADSSGTDQDHAVGAIVEFGPDILWAQSVIDGLSELLTPSTGLVDTTKVVTPTGTQTLTNKTLTSPKVETNISDTNGNEIIKTPATASAVNEITVTNAATGNAPEVSATGGDTNIALNLKAKGSGSVTTLDGNGNELIKTATTSSAVNEITVTNAATGGKPQIAATGDDTNIPLNLVSKGTGSVQANGLPLAQVLLASAAASNSATVDLTSLPTSGYSAWKVIVTGLYPATDSASLFLRISTGASFKSGASDYAWRTLIYGVDTGTESAADTADSEIEFNTASALSNDTADVPFSAEIIIFDPAGTSYKKNIQYNFSYSTTAAIAVRGWGAGFYIGATTALDGLRFLASSGNISVGNFYVYGIRSS